MTTAGAAKPAADPRDPLLSSKQVAEILAVSPRTVCLWAECGEIPGVKIGKQWRFRTSDIEFWISQKKSLAEPKRWSGA